MHVPSQPLMRLPLSGFQTPTCPRRASRFFRVWLLVELPQPANHSVYFGLAKFYLSQPFRPSTESTLNSYVEIVIAAFRCILGILDSHQSSMQAVELLVFVGCLESSFLLLHRSFHSCPTILRAGPPEQTLRMNQRTI